MINFIRIVLLLLLVLVSMYSINQYDSMILIYLYNYKIKVSLFFLCFLTFILLGSLCIIYGLVKKFLSIPGLVSTSITNSYNKKQLDLILNSYMLLLSKQSLDARLVSKLGALNLHTRHSKFLLCMNNSNFDDKLCGLKSLLDISELSFYANNELAKLLYDASDYNDALVYARNAFEISNNNKELNLLLLSIYGKLSLWEDYESLFGDIEEEIKNSVSSVQESVAKDLNNISDYYFNKKNYKESIKFLELSLRYNPRDIGVIEKLCRLYITTGSSESVKYVLDDAFRVKPSFALFLLYKELNSNLDKVDIYEILCSLVNPKEKTALFIAIASFLGLKDKSDDLIKSIN